jgi:maltose operon protein
MMRLFVIFAAVVLSGCSQLEQSSQEEDRLGLFALQESVLCCDSFDQVPFNQLDEGSEKLVVIDLNSPSYDFATGKSFFAAFELPQTNSAQVVTIISTVQDNVFVPSMTVLGQDFENLTNTFIPKLVLEGRAISHPQRYVLTVTVNSQESDTARYIILHTTKDAIEGETVRDLPKDVVAQTGQTMANSKMLLSPNIEHSAFGQLKMTVIGDGSPKREANSKNDKSESSTNSISDIEKLQTSLTSVEKKNYGLEIIEAVKQDDLNEAMGYVMKAQDSELAQSIFTRAIKVMP